MAMQKLLLAILLLLPTLSQAQVLRFEWDAPTVAFGGREFPGVGRYERVTGRATMALDPRDPRNAVMADLAEAPRTPENLVQAVADVFILRPAEAARGNGAMLLEVPNRGRKLMLQLFADTRAAVAEATEVPEAAGNGFLYQQGYSLVWVGWQGDIASRPGQMALQVPRLPGVTGPVTHEVVFDHLTNPASTTLPFPVADAASLRVTVRARWDLPRETPADLRFTLQAERLEIQRPAGFDAGAIYEVTYTGKEPGVMGMGFAAVRDVASWLRHDRSAQNPLAGRIQRAHAFGISQSGRYLRDYLYLGFNQDLAGRPVFDGVMPHIAGARRLFGNSRFAQPDRAPRSPQDVAWPADSFPFSYAETRDPINGARDSLLRRCRASATCPRVMQTDTEYEYWSARASLVVTDPAGHALALPPDVRAYAIAGTPHFSAFGAETRTTPVCALPVNPLHAGAPMRALLTALDAWTRDGTAPPASRTPSRADGTLVPAVGAVPAIPGLRYAAQHALAARVDASQQPPRELGRYTVLVPRADADGIGIGGIRMPVLEAPRATYTGWNPRAEGYGAGVLCPLLGGVLPLAETRAAREAAGDPRPSLAERYPTPAAYVAQVRAAADHLVAERLLLPADAAAMVTAAEAGRLVR